MMLFVFQSEVSNLRNSSFHWQFLKVKVKSLSPVWLCDPMDCSLPGSSVYGIFQQGYWSGLPFPSPGDLPNPGIDPVSPALAGRCFTIWASRKASFWALIKMVLEEGHWEDLTASWLSSLPWAIGSSSPIPVSSLECAFCLALPWWEPSSRTWPWEQCVVETIWTGDMAESVHKF